MKKSDLKVRATSTGSEYTLVAVEGGYDVYGKDNYKWGFCSTETGKDNVASGQWELILPDEFDFVSKLTGSDYHAKRSGEGYAISWKGTFGAYRSLKDVCEFLIKDYYIVDKESEANGFDAEGNPLNFTEDDLQLFQRVELENGKMHVVAPNVQTEGVYSGAKHALVTEVGWDMWDANNKNGFAPVAVYAAPSSNKCLLNPLEKGTLIWTSKDYENNKRKKELEDTITAKQREVEALMSELNSL